MLAVTVEVTKCVDMRNVNGFIALFAQFGLFPCAIRPLPDAALDLMTSTNPSASRARARRSHPYHCEYKGNNFKWDHGCEVFMKDNPIVLLVLEPHEIDSCLDNGMSIWIMWKPFKVGIL
jgi:hypothetical protein